MFPGICLKISGLCIKKSGGRVIMFKIDSPLMNFLNRMADIMILNALFILCCLPVFTIGASLSAAYYICYKMIRNEDSYIVKGFFKSFKENFKQATVIWLFVLLIAGILFVDYRIVLYSGIDFPQWSRVALVSVSIVALIGTSFMFPLQARFSNTIKNTIKNGFIMALTHLPSAVILAVSVVIPFVLLYFVPQILPVIIFLAFGGVLYFQAGVALKVFKKYEEAIIERQNQEKGEAESEDSGIFAGSDMIEKNMDNEKN